MIYKAGETLIDTEKCNLASSIISEIGQDCIVYSYQNQVLKLYRDDFLLEKRLLSEKIAKKTKKINKIPLEIYVPPKQLVYDEDKRFCGYLTEKISDTLDYKAINSMQKRQFFAWLKKLLEETKRFSQSRIIVEDVIYLYNIMFDEMPRIVDLSSFNFSDNIEKANNKNTYIINLMLLLLLFNGKSYEECEEERFYFRKSGHEHYADYLQENFGNYDYVDDYVNYRKIA